MVERLIDWLGSDEDSDLRRAFAAWLRLVLVPMKLGDEDPLPEVDNLMEMQTMLLENMQRWADNFKAELRAEAWKEARAEAWKEARAEAKREAAAEVRAAKDDGATDLLSKQVETKFGPLSETHHSRLRSASSAQRERWALQLLDAESLEELFAGG